MRRGSFRKTCYDALLRGTFPWVSSLLYLGSEGGEAVHMSYVLRDLRGAGGTGRPSDGGRPVLPGPPVAVAAELETRSSIAPQK
jgi:hypothetical protein